jgi:hypothetical protein
MRFGVSGRTRSVARLSTNTAASNSGAVRQNNAMHANWKDSYTDFLLAYPC